MFNTWDIVRPRYWHPMASLEQSMMDFEQMQDRMMQFPSLQGHHSSFDDDDDEFFQDLPIRRRQQAQAAHQQQQQQQASNQGDSNTFSSYSYSSSSIIDDKGQRVTSSRRRYEDSTGRLKAIHERQIGDKKVRSVWNRLDKSDTGKHETMALDGSSTEEFEKMWKETVFGAAEAKKRTEAITEKGEAGQK
ncbi:hypothetical protein Poli38472_008289 [Pythium oligandrum]|uniref:Myeloid leukemia factor n=1 Tax=Pythium oligandrum TaxID=41045 RepID=A0A8K1CLF3_PYTOL|nr:hypothetical protein Poli38472_008289 [Pythium oligandrum]|eukprot:TMW65647.1 hypothetical protein Poli38472_008289 [Pythium oligandrum]